MKFLSNPAPFGRTALIVTALLASFAASAAGPWQLLGSTDKGMEMVDSYPSEADCKKAMAAAMQRQGQRDFMCTIAGTAGTTLKK